MKSPLNNSTSSWLDTGDDDEELRPLEACLLKFMWVCSEHLDSVDFIKTAILIRSLSVGKRMTRAVVCDMLAEFTRFFRCAQKGSKFNSKNCDTWCSKTKEALESWMNYDMNKHQRRRQRQKAKAKQGKADRASALNLEVPQVLCTADTTDTEKPENGHFSYQNPFDCPRNLDAVLKSLTMTDKEQTASTKTTEEVDDNQNLLLTVKDVSKTLEKYTKRYSTYLHSLDKGASASPTGRSAYRELLDSTGSSSELEDTHSVPAANEKSELLLSECLLQQSVWLESVLKDKTPEKGDSYGCYISNGEENEVQEEEGVVLAEFISLAQNFLPIWSSENTELNGLGSNSEEEEYQKQMFVLETDSCPQKSPASTSTILEEISMDISDSFEEWLADSRNVELLQSKQLQSLPDGFLDLQKASTPLEELQDEKDQVVESLWPELPTVNPHTRRRLWDDTDIGVNNLPTDTDIGVKNLPTDTDIGVKNLPTDRDIDVNNLPTREASSSGLGPQRKEKTFYGSTNDGLAEEDFQDIYLSNKPMPSVDELSFFYPDESIAPTTQPTKMRPTAQQLQQPSRTRSMPSGAPSQPYLRAAHTMPQHHDPHLHAYLQTASQNSHPQMQHHDQAANTNLTWAQRTLDGFLPRLDPNCTTVTQSRNYGQGPMQPYRLWAPPNPNTVHPMYGLVPPPVSNNSLRYHTPIGAGRNGPPSQHYADWKRTIRQQVLQRPPVRNDHGRLAPNPSVPTHHTMRQPQQPIQQHRPDYNANLPSSKAPTEFDVFYQQEMQRKAWSAAEHLATNGQLQARSGVRTGTAFMSDPLQHWEHQAFMQRQKLESQKYMQQQQQPPMQQQLPRQGHAMPDVVPPWRRTRPPQNTMSSLNPDPGFAPSTFEAWAAGQIQANVPEKRLGTEQEMANLSGHNTMDYWGPDLHYNNTNTNNNTATRNGQYNNASQMPTSNVYFTSNAPQWPPPAESHDMNRQKDFTANDWQHLHKQIRLQANLEYYQKHAPPDFHHYQIQRDQELQQQQQQFRQGVPSMAEVARASLGHYKAHAQHLQPSGDQRYQSVIPPMM